MTSSAPEGRPKGEILKANVETAPTERESAPRRSGPGPGRAVLPLVLAGVLLFVLGAGAALFWSTSQRAQQAQQAQPGSQAQQTPQARPAQPAQQAQPAQPAPQPGARGAAPTALTAPLPATGQTGSAASAGALAPVNGISCDALEGTIVHIHVHLAIFVNGQEQQVPFGIGIGQPWQVSDSDQGPFVDDGSCFYWIHTHTEDGVIHIESPVRRRFTLGDFFAVWQLPLSANQMGPAQGPIISYVNGQRSSTEPQDIPLLPHARIQLDIGADVPPYQFDFPPGD